MAKGKLKRVDNLDARFGADPWYWFLKVQSPGRAESNEEYWLVTEEESVKFAERAEKNPEDVPDHSRRGVLRLVENTEARFGAAGEYHEVLVVTPAHDHVHWMLTEFDLDRIRERVEKNREDVEANREGWLADLFD